MPDDSRNPVDPKGELLSRLNELLERLLAEEKTPTSTVHRVLARTAAFFQSSFFITVVGGVLLAWLPFQWQQRASDQREREAESARIAERKERLAYQFAKDFPLSAHLIGRFRKRQLWMASEETHGTNKAYADGRTFAETRDYTEKLVDQYLTLGPTASMCNQIAASFPNSAKVTTLARALSENVTAMINATNEMAIETAYAQASGNYHLLTEAVFTELNKKNENDAVPH